MDEKKVREAIKHFKHLKDVLENYLKIPNAEENLGAEIIFIKKDIEVYETAIEALEKQLPMKVVIWGNRTEHCPVCDKDVTCTGVCVCPECYQLLDWSEAH